jgi:hypothetical protein
LVPVTVELVLLHGDTPCVILVNVIQKLMYFDDWSTVSVKQNYNTYGTYESMSPTNCTDSGQ